MPCTSIVQYHTSGVGSSILWGSWGRFSPLGARPGLCAQTRQACGCVETPEEASFVFTAILGYLRLYLEYLPASFDICRYLQISTGIFKCLPASLDICRYLWASGDISHSLAGYLLIGWHIPKAYRRRQAAMKPAGFPKLGQATCIVLYQPAICGPAQWPTNASRRKCQSEPIVE